LSGPWLGPFASQTGKLAFDKLSNALNKNYELASDNVLPYYGANYWQAGNVSRGERSMRIVKISKLRKVEERGVWKT